MPKGVKMKSQALSCQRSHVSFITEKQRCIYKPYGYNLDKTKRVTELQQRHGPGWNGCTAKYAQCLSHDFKNALPHLVGTLLCLLCNLQCYLLTLSHKLCKVSLIVFFDLSEPDHYFLSAFLNCIKCHIVKGKSPTPF